MTASIGCCKIIGTIEYSAYFAAKKPLKDFWTFKEQICEDFCLIMLKYFDIESIFYRKTSALNKKYSMLKTKAMLQLLMSICKRHGIFSHSQNHSGPDFKRIWDLILTFRRTQACQYVADIVTGV